MKKAWYSPIVKLLFFGLFVKPCVLLLIGLNVQRTAPLNKTGPLILVGNHNSHLDAMVMMSLFPLSTILKVRPVAAADYFLKNKLIAWFALNVLGIIPLKRNGEINKETLLNDCEAALHNGEILIIFPEGSRGEPGQLSPFKKGVYHLAIKIPECQIQPIVMTNLGKILPKGEAILVPFNCTVVIDAPQNLNEHTDKDAFISSLQERFRYLLDLNSQMSG